jgi:hypothetical protein
VSQTKTNMNPFIDRMIRAAKLDVRLYEKVEADKWYTRPNHERCRAVQCLNRDWSPLNTVGLEGLVIGTTMA